MDRKDLSQAKGGQASLANTIVMSRQDRARGEDCPYEKLIIPFILDCHNLIFAAILISMCGICGIYHSNNSPVSESHLRRMTAAIAHRGPDGDGFHVQDNIGLGFQRLAIIDLNTGDQPIFNEDHSIATVFNGEIYNYRVLRDELIAAGHQFRSKTDTEVLVHGYEAWGLDLIHRLRGMYAFAIWDEPRQRLLLVRDRMGQKPLYYAHTGDGVVFGSEIKALLQHPDLPRRINTSVLAEYLTLGFVLPPETLFEGVMKLAPGSMLIIERNQTPQLQTYWQPTLNPTDQRSQQEIAQSIREMLEAAVEMQLMSDVPLGTFLSGGVDSTTITSLTGKLTGNQVRSFTVGFDFERDSIGDRKFNVDLHYAREAAVFLNCDHREIVLKHGDALAQLLPQLVYALDEPVVDTAIMQTAFVAALARAHQVPVLLSGDGADEIFGGYGFFQEDVRVQQLQRWLPPSVAGYVANKLPAQGRLAVLHKLLEKVKLISPTERYLTWQSENSFETTHSWMQDRDLAHYGLDCMVQDIDRLMQPLDSPDMADKVAYARLRYWLAEDSNMRFDKMTMWMSIEARSPFQDHEMVDLALSIPLRHKLPGKKVLKDAVADLVPASVLNRPKWGFIPPASDWLRTIFYPLIETYLSPERLRATGLNPEPITAMVRAHMERRGYYLNELWSLLVLQLWFALYIDESLTLEARWSAQDLTRISQ